MYWKNAVASWRNQSRRYKFLGQRGTIISWTKIENPPISFETQTSYFIALVDFGRLGRIMGQVVGSPTLHIGDQVEGILRRLYTDGDAGVITYGTKFKKVTNKTHE